MEVEAEYHTGGIGRQVGMNTGNLVNHWDWKFFGKSSGRGWAWARVLRYRIRKPKGMEILEQNLQKLEYA